MILRKMMMGLTLRFQNLGIYLAVSLFLFFGCRTKNGYYSSAQDSNIETIRIGSTNYCELSLSANQLDDKINLIVYLDKINQDKFTITTIYGTVNSIDFSKASSFIYIGADKLSFADYLKLSADSSKEYIGNVQLYLQFDKAEFKKIEELAIDVSCVVQSIGQIDTLRNELLFKRHNRIFIHR